MTAGSTKVPAFEADVKTKAEALKTRVAGLKDSLETRVKTLKAGTKSTGCEHDRLEQIKKRSRELIFREGKWSEAIQQVPILPSLIYARRSVWRTMYRRRLRSLTSPMRDGISEGQPIGGPKQELHQ